MENIEYTESNFDSALTSLFESAAAPAASESAAAAPGSVEAAPTPAAPAQEAVAEDDELPDLEAAEAAPVSAVSDKPVEESVAEVSATTEAVGDVPDGVRAVRLRDGTMAWRMPEAMAKQWKAHIDNISAIESKTGEPLTPEFVERSVSAMNQLADVRVKFSSGNPTTQREVFRDLLYNGYQAFQAGEVAENPNWAASVAFVQELEHAAPGIAKELRHAQFKAHIGELMQAAPAAENDNYRKALQYIEKLATGKFTPKAEIANSAAASAAETRLQAIEQERYQQTQQAADQARHEFIESARTTFVTARDSELTSAFAEIDEHIKDPMLARQAKATLKQDYGEAWNSAPALWRAHNITILSKGANGSQAVREAARNDLQARYSAYAKTLIGPIKSKVISDNTRLIASRMNAVNDKAKAAAARTKTPTGSPVKPTIRPDFTPDNFEAWIEQVVQ